MAIRHVLVPVFLVAGILASPALATPVSASASCGWSVASTPNPSQLGSASLNGVAAFSSTDVWVVGALFDYLTLSEHWDGTAWTVVDTPNPGKSSDVLSSVDGVSTNDLWAVGQRNGLFSGPSFTLIEHWGGTAWSVVSSPNPGKTNALQAVHAVAADDVWAVGWAGDDSGTRSTLVEHWDGTSWTVVPSPSPGSGDNRLAGLSAPAPDDVWAVGRQADTGKSNLTLIEHWDGTAWSVVPSPNSGTSELFGVVAISASDAWAVGEAFGGGFHSLAEHWNGTAWSLVHVPDVAPGYNPMQAVDATASNDVWAVGSGTEGNDPETKHYNGSAWSVVAAAGLGAGYTPILRSVDALAPNDVWAAGDAEGDVLDDFFFGPLPLIEHWDGTSWSIVPSPAVGSFNGLNAVSAAGESAVWAAGNSNSGRLIERWNGTSWKVTGPPSGAGDQWTSVDAISPTDVWVIGFSPGGSGGEEERPLALHWNGSRWKSVYVPPPAASASDTGTFSVSGTSAHDVWAVGLWFGGVISPRPLIEHWNGKKWIPLQGPGVKGALTDVLALSPSNAWAVGEQGRTQSRTLIEHWDGTKWAVVSSPSPHPSADRLNAIGGTAHSLWAVGSSAKDVLVLHRSKGTWHTENVADPGATPASLADVAVAHGGVWAVGTAGDQALIEHRAAGKWKVEDVPSPGPTSELSGITAVPGSSTLWAVGTYFGDDQYKTLALRCS